MGSETKEILHDVPPYLRVYKDGSIERLLGFQVVPPGLDPATAVISKDLHTPAIAARLYRPTTTSPTQKLPLLIYFHGGAFCVASTSFPLYHHSLNSLVAHANIVALSVDYRLAPEHPLPAAFHDASSAIRWVASHLPPNSGAGTEPWLNTHVDFDRVFLGGDSAGATIAHHMAMTRPVPDLKISGIVLIDPYFWGKEPIGVEILDVERKRLVDKWWEFVCTSGLGLDDPIINPFVDGAPDLSGLGCGRVIVTVTEKDILRDRGWVYYERLMKSKWGGKVEIFEVEGEDHVFHILDPDGEKAVNLMKRLGEFINKE